MTSRESQGLTLAIVWLLVSGAVNILWGAGAVASLPLGFAIAVLVATGAWYSAISGGLAVSGLAMVAGGVGLLSDQEWGRVVSGVGAVVSGVVRLAMAVVVLRALPGQVGTVIVLVAAAVADIAVAAYVFQEQRGHNDGFLASTVLEAEDIISPLPRTRRTVLDRPTERAHAWLAPKSRSAGTQRLDLKKRRTTIGRSSRAHITLADRKVSAEHAAIIVRDGRHYIVDVGSRNGTWVNDKVVKDERMLIDGDRLRFGDSRFVYKEA